MVCDEQGQHVRVAAQLRLVVPRDPFGLILQAQVGERDRADFTRDHAADAQEGQPEEDAPAPPAQDNSRQVHDLRDDRRHGGAGAGGDRLIRRAASGQERHWISAQSRRGCGRDRRRAGDDRDGTTASGSGVEAVADRADAPLSGKAAGGGGVGLASVWGAGTVVRVGNGVLVGGTWACSSGAVTVDVATGGLVGRAVGIAVLVGSGPNGVFVGGVWARATGHAVRLKRMRTAKPRLAIIGGRVGMLSLCS